jgi:dTDP-4-dehydrorhamnose 3,5-epimerase
MIDGVLLNELKQFADERGKVMHMLRRDAPFFRQFGEVYFSVVRVGVIKGWKKHLRMTQHLAVPVGAVRVVIYDDRNGSATAGQVDQYELGEASYRLLRIPPGVWYAFGNTGAGPALIANCADLPHDPREMQTRPLESPEIPFSWSDAAT